MIQKQKILDLFAKYVTPDLANLTPQQIFEAGLMAGLMQSNDKITLFTSDASYLLDIDNNTMHIVTSNDIEVLNIQGSPNITVHIDGDVHNITATNADVHCKSVDTITYAGRVNDED